MGMVFGKIDVETPKHEVVLEKDGFQVRKYPPQVAATVDSSSMENSEDDRKFSSEAFSTLAKYIGVFGQPKNQKRSETGGEKVAMTAPVVMQDDKAEGEKVAMTGPVIMEDNKAQGEKMDMTAPVEVQSGKTMTFLLPAKYTLDTAPVPTDSRVRVHEIPERHVAVLQWNGNLSREVAKQKKDELVGKLKDAGIKYDESKWSYAGYNPPFTIPFLKTSEVFVPVEM
mmetsp:Transcript_4819/g.14524  ORF Transcript_4819/g.14524 Transcript_4819/m.14524 type:complete len:226 (-) Transcript_4819:1191-1868(-)